MRTLHRNLVAYVLLACGFGLVAWAASFGTLPPAEFTFCNATEIKTVDPALVTGQPEGRVIEQLFEGLTTKDPETLEPLPGVAERWAISDDLRTYTFHLRDNARWSDGTPVVADDFVWSYRRFLHPELAAEYSQLFWYVANAERYTKKQFGVGERVEVELADRPVRSQTFPRGTVLKGILASIDEPVTSVDPGSGNKTYTVTIDGQSRRFHVDGLGGAEPCMHVLLDFDEVGVRALDSRTLEIRLTEPTPFFLRLLAFYPLSPVNPRCVEQHGFPGWTKPENIVSNGPYRLLFRRIRDRLRLVRNPHFWNADKVGLDSIDILAVNSSPTMLNLYLTGQVDWIPTVPNTVLDALRERKDLVLRPYLGTYFYLINTTRDVLKDRRVRQALNQATDKNEICTRVVKAGQIPARSLVPPGLEGYTSPQCGEYDVEAARRLLALAGYPGGEGFPTIEILYNTDEGHRLIAEVIQSQWKRNLGIDVRLANMEWGIFLTEQRKLNFWTSRMGWIGDYADPNTFLDMFITNSPNNRTGWSNAEFDRLLVEASRQPDPVKRLEILRQAEAILLDDVPIIPIYYYVSTQLVRPYVKGWYPNVLDQHPLDAVTIDRAQKESVLRAEGIW